MCNSLFFAAQRNKSQKPCDIVYKNIMSKIRKDERVTVAQSFLSGGIAGVASRTITSPLDVVKILAQVGTKETKNGFIKSFINIHQREGTKAFWKGNLVACYRLFPYNAIQFATYYKLKNSFADARGNISSFNALASGSLAGVFATIMTYPLDMVKTRLTVAHADKNISKYSGIKDCIMKIYKEEGAKAFYKGMNTSIIGVIPFAGGTFMAYEFLNKAWAKPRDKMTPLENFVNGCLAAAFAQTFSFPFDTIRKKLQAQSHVVFEDMKPDVAFNGMLDAFKQTIRKHGVLGLWRGTTANLAKVVPYAGIMFAVFEQSRRMFMWWNGYTSSPFVDRPIQGVDQNLTPTELKLWYEEKKRRESA